MRDWAIVLAGGEGKRLAALTRALYREDVPKQFAVLAGERSLLQRTVERIAPLAPTHRVVVVVTEPHEQLARRQLAPYPGVAVAVQPANLDTGPGVLFGLAQVLARDPDARVTLFPADHHVDHPARFLAAVDAARAASRHRITLVGARPDRAEAEYGWILPSGRARDGAARVRRVARFVEKPPPREAARLFDRGGLWNTFVLASRVTTLWSLARRRLPEHAASLGKCAAVVDPSERRRAFASVYARMAPANFSRAVLAHARDMSVAEAADTGWSDWGTPRRVFASLEGTRDHASLVARIAFQA